MFIKSLVIKNDNGIIRDLHFKKGLNFIVDEALNGNNVGKTTVLKLINYCLGSGGGDIYDDDVKDFLINTNVIVTLTLVSDLENNNDEIVLERNFHRKTERILKLNNENYDMNTYHQKLKEIIFKDSVVEKPTLRQLIAHNIRYSEYATANTIKHINVSIKDDEYEALYLYMLGLPIKGAKQKHKLMEKYKKEIYYKERLGRKLTITGYKSLLKAVEQDIENLEQKKNSFNINEDFEKDIENLTIVKKKISKLSSEIEKLSRQKEVVNNTIKSLDCEESDINETEIKELYNEAIALKDDIQKSFEEIVSFHNEMVENKKAVIGLELSSINEELLSKQEEMKQLLIEEKLLTEKTTKYEVLNEIINQLNKCYKEKEKWEKIITWINDTNEQIEKYSTEIDKIGEDIYNDEFYDKIQTKLDLFNEKFCEISNSLCSEKYRLVVEKKVDVKTEKPYYNFTTFSANNTSSIKQGEILAFELAYIAFANENNIPCLHFLLNDKKELMHYNQLLKLPSLLIGQKVQVVIPILKEKLPDQIEHDANIVVSLSQTDNFFKI